MSLACSRSLFFIAFTAGAFALGASYYLEYAVGLTPCSLCLVQRLFLTLLCIGCGVCSLVCEPDAIEMRRREQNVIHPETTFERVILQCLERVEELDQRLRAQRERQGA